MWNSLGLAVIALTGVPGTHAASEDALTALIAQERAFSGCAREKGIRHAFLEFLADDSLVFQPHPTDGRTWYAQRESISGALIWTPTYAAVSRSGDLGFTTGPWTYRRDGMQGEVLGKGSYVSLWRRNDDGEFKLILDVGVSHDHTEDCRDLTRHVDTLSWQRWASTPKAESRDSSLDRMEPTVFPAARGADFAGWDAVHRDLLTFRENHAPQRGASHVKTWEPWPSDLVYQPLQVISSGQGDLVLTLGSFECVNAQNTPPFGYSVRIWIRNSGRTMLLLDALVPAPAPPPEHHP